MKILVAEDKRSLASHIGRVLEDEGHTVTLAYDGDQALRLGKTAGYDLLLLDVMLPQMDGLSVIKKLRADRLRLQTILVSARDTMQHIINGLDAGADDYLVNPFALDVLLAKVRATERRLPDSLPQSVSFRDLRLEPHTFQLKRGTRVCSLTRTECLLLEVLIRNARRVVSHAMLIEAGWGLDTDVSYDSLYVLIRALRSKITVEGEIELLHTTRGVGYSLRSQVW